MTCIGSLCNVERVDRMHALSSDLVVYVARLVRDVRRHNAEIPAASTRVLSLVDELGPSTVGVLADNDRCSQPTMSGLVNGLVERGWVARSPHPDDSRASLVSLTELGHKTLAGLRQNNADLIARRMAAAGRSADDLEQVVAVLRDLLPSKNDETEGQQ
ncbi:MAG: MarR family transcriptional regulator [Nocardioidaceae bacterium]|nr:MarR family transcriptional regulator [Nocardioidaceae bacterium]